MSTATERELIEAAAALAAEGASRTDRESRAPEELFARLGELGAFGLGLASDLGPGERMPGRADVAAYARLVAAVAAECMSTAFSLWAHRMVITYLRDGGEELAPLLDDLLAGRRAGSIAMATAMQELAGIGGIPTRAVPDGEGGYRVHGTIAWASNVAPGTVAVLPARVVETADAQGDDGGERVIVAAIVGEPGIEAREVEDLLALGATRSAMLRFDGLRVPAERVLATSLAACRAKRGTHLLLQSAFCLGLAGRCLAEAGERVEGAGSVMTAHHARLEQQRRRLSEAVAAATAPGAEPEPRDVTLIRYEAGRLAHAAARHEAALVGGRGYVTTSATNRRLREASFLPVQSPSEVQLLQELEGLGIHPAEEYTL